MAEPVQKEPWAVVISDAVRTGGMDVANHALISWLARTGHEVNVVAHRIEDDLAALPNVRFHPVPRPLGANVLGWPLLEREGRRVAEAVAARGGRVVVNGGNCRFGDVNWVHYVHAVWTPNIVAPLHRRLRYRLTHQISLADERAAIPKARLVIADSERTRRDVIEALGVPAERVRTVYYGIDPERFRPLDEAARATQREALGWRADRRYVAFIGALSDRRKGFDTVFDAWRRLCRSPGWDADLVVIGTGAELPAWRARAAASGFGDRFQFLGFRRDVPRVLGACDALVAPTRYEAYGLGVHEALCCGLPALVSASAGVAERYPASLSELLLPDPDDVSDLVRRLEAWRADEAGHRARVLELSNTLRRFTWDDMAKQLVELAHAYGGAASP